MADERFITGIVKKYPPEVLEGRVEVEGSVVACLWKDPMLLDDYNFSKEDFITKDGKFYFSLAKTLRKKGVNVFDEVSIYANLNEKIQEEFDNRGGMEVIENMTSVVHLANFEGYRQQLIRENALLSLCRLGINLKQPVKFNGQKVVPIELCKKWTAEQVIEFYDSLLSSIDIGQSSKIREQTTISFNKDWLKSLAEGEHNGVPYGESYPDVFGEPMKCFPILSRRTAGLMPGYVHMVGGFSSAGKSTMLITILMALLAQDKKIIIFSNEEGADKYQLKFFVWLLEKYCHEGKTTKRGLTSGDFDEENPALDVVMEWWEETIQDRVRFIRISDADISTVVRTSRKAVLDEGFDVVVYDTFKIQSSDMRENRQDLALIRDIRRLDDFAKKYDVPVLTTVQLAEGMKGRLWLDASCLSNSKQIKEQLENLFLIRNVYDDELDPSSRHYIRPYKRKKVDGVWVDEEVIPDRNKSWIVLFLEKARSGANSSNTNTAYLLSFDGDHSVFEEVCQCRPRHGTIS